MAQVSPRTDLFLAGDAGPGVALRDIVALLTQILALGSIARAAEQCNLSYRHAWGLLRSAEAALEGPLITKSRGKGSLVTPLGEILMRAEATRTQRLDGLAQRLSDEVTQQISDEIQRLRGAPARLRVLASHGYAVAALLDALQASGAAIDFSYRESVEAVRMMSRGDCELAGFHLPLGEFRAACGAGYRASLDPRRHVLIYLTRRKQGLFLPPGNPAGVHGLADLARPALRFVNRQPGSGTRILLDLALRAQGIEPATVNGHATTELSHSAIAAFVASGMADVGFGVEPAARQFGLDFLPVLEEDYFFVGERRRLEAAPLADMLKVLRTPAFHRVIDRLAGYNARECGKVLEIDAGFDSA
ncbi:MAG: substrate-binding domain-containing protein [Janthinobacterium lividum]